MKRLYTQRNEEQKQRSRNKNNCHCRADRRKFSYASSRGQYRVPDIAFSAAPRAAVDAMFAVVCLTV